MTDLALLCEQLRAELLESEHNVLCLVERNHLLSAENAILKAKEVEVAKKPSTPEDAIADEAFGDLKKRLLELREQLLEMRYELEWKRDVIRDINGFLKSEADSQETLRLIIDRIKYV